MPLHVFYQPNDPRLSDEQKQAVKGVLESNDRVILLEGRAGVGKTTLLKETVAGIEERGKQVYAYAPSASASRGTLRQEGFDKAETVANLLDTIKTQEGREKLRGQVILIDEAGLLSSPQMRQILEVAKEQKARVILTGDPRQHRSVERGRAWELLRDKAGLPVQEVSTIRRQRVESYREAVQEASEGRLGDSFERLDRLGWIKEIPGQKARHKALVKDYMEAEAQGQKVLIVSPTHAEAAAVTKDVRRERQAQGMLGKEEQQVTGLRNLQWTEAQRSDPTRYEPGQAVAFQRATAGGFKARDVWTVDRVEADKEQQAQRVVLRHADGREAPLPLDRSKQFNVYERESLGIRAGDQVRITANGQTLDGERKLHNGTLDRVEGFTEAGDLKLAGGGVLAKDYGHVQYGYVVTSHASQGKTVDRVLIAQSSPSLPASDRAQFYVSLSRGREQVTIYTDDRAELLRAAGRSRDQVGALDMLNKTRTMNQNQFDEHKGQVERDGTGKAGKADKESAPGAYNNLDQWAEAVKQQQVAKQQRAQPDKGKTSELDQWAQQVSDRKTDKKAGKDVDRNAFDDKKEEISKEDQLRIAIELRKKQNERELER